VYRTEGRGAAARKFDRHIVFSLQVMRDDFRAGEEM
jgi:hypothetical protein